MAVKTYSGTRRVSSTNRKEEINSDVLDLISVKSNIETHKILMIRGSQMIGDYAL